MNGISIKDVSYQINDTVILTEVSFKSDAKRIAVQGATDLESPHYHV